MGEMTIAAQRWYPVPNKTDPVANFSSWCHITQIFQADFYKNQIMFYRRGSGMPERQLGSLYWQLEDIWQAPTWAGIEYDGRWKVLHYTAKDIYENVIISPFHNVTTGDFEVYVTSDLWKPATGTATFAWYDWAGNQINISTPDSVNFTIGAINTTCLLSAHLPTLLSLHDPRNVTLRTSLIAQGYVPNHPSRKTFTHTNWFHASPLSQANLVDPDLQLRFYGDSFSVRASSGVAAWVWFDYPGGSVVQFEENGFWLTKGEERTVRYKVISGVVDEEWARGVTVESLWDMTQP
jgi:beta-mannosidase